MSMPVPDAGKEFVKKRTKRRPLINSMLDFSLGFAGLFLALASIYFPFHVYYNAQKFGPPRMVFDGRDTQADQIEEVVASSTRKPLFQDSSPGIDPFVTGSVAGRPPQRDDKKPMPLENFSPSTLKREFDVPGQWQLVFASRGRALIRDGEDIFPVAIGSRLPDGSTVKSVLGRNQRWRLTTSRNLVLELVDR